jgi:diguanylate cyclase (GGDEF)-like protein/PAS domain S-box-containing protein
MTNKNYALKISLVYLVFGVLWILLSDTFVGSLSLNREVVTSLSVIKGWIYVGLSTLLIYIIGNRYIRKLRQANQLQQKSYDELIATNENNAQLHTQLKQELEELERREQTIHAIFDATNDAIIVHNAESAEITNYNHKAEVLFGFTLKEIQEIGITNIDIRCCNGKLVETIRNAPTEGSKLLKWFATNKWGKRLYLETNYCKVTIGGTQCVLAVSRDLSERKNAAAELARAQAQKLALFKAIPDLMLLFDDQGIFLDYNQPTNFDLYVPPEQFLGKSMSDIFPAEFTQKALGHIKQTINSGDIQLLEYQLLQNDQLHYFEARFVKSGDSEALAIIRDITYKKQLEQRLEFFSLHDSLTEVYNRTYFEEHILKIRSNNDKGVGIIVCDVDGLKLINDTLGHCAGDELLKIVAKTLKSCASFTDVVARIGGDEFSIIVFEPDQQKMTELSAAIKMAVKKYNKTNLQLPLSLSIGWSANFSGHDDIDTLFKEADNNMYREKMHQGLSNHSAIVQAMMKALEARDFITEGHADRLQSLVEDLAQKLQLSSPMIADLKLLAKFHDIGKVGIPDNILFKPGRLKPDEAIIMRSHCDIGFRIAKSAPDLVPIAEWILKHQEWWNGKGYPLKLAGEEIPLACRVLTLADAFDAMTNDRPYRKAMNIQEAIDEIRKCAGTQFDPVLTEYFIEMLTR